MNTNNLEHVILDLLETTSKNVKTHPLNLGGVAGAGGGFGGPPGGFIGWLPQTNVAYDQTEAATLNTASSGYAAPSGWSLLDNLNHIRYRLNILESGASITVVDDNEVLYYYDVDTIHFSGAGVTVVDLGGGDVQVKITATGSGGSGSPIIIENLTPQVPSLDNHFDLSYVADSGTLRLYYNGIRQPPSSGYYLEDGDGMGFTTQFPTYSGDTIVVDYGNDGSASLIEHEFGIVAVSGQSSVIADTVEDTLTLVAGSGITITTNPGSDSITFALEGSQSVSTTPDRTRILPLVTDFLEINVNVTGGTMVGPFEFIVTSNGLLNQYLGDATHPGYLTIACGTNANSGGYIYPNNNAIIIAGGEVYESIFRVDQSTNLIGRLGMFDTVNQTAPTDGIWIDIAATTLSGKCAKSGGATTTTGTTTTLSVGTWYRCKITVSSDTNTVTFYLYSESGTLLWSDTVTADIPVTNRLPAAKVVAVKTTSSGGTTNILTSDWIAFWCTRTIAR